MVEDPENLVVSGRGSATPETGPAMSSIESFEETAKLDTPALRRLLASPRPEQRVWAIWALALREAGDLPELARQTAIEPNPGVRRTLAVVLAGHGEDALLIGLARHDPDLAVRESAMQLVTRLAAGHVVDPAVVIDAAGREPAIQIAVLTALDARAPEALVQLADRLLDAADERVQLEAFEALLRIDTQAARARALAWLRGAPDPIAIEACRRWSGMAGPELIARELASSPERIRAIALRQLGAPPWSAIERLVDGDMRLLAEVVERADVSLPPRVVGELVIEHQCRHFVGRLRDCLSGLAAVPEDFVPLVAELRRHCGRRLQELERERAAVDEASALALPAGVHGQPDELGTFLDAAEGRRAEHDQVAGLLAELDRLAIPRTRSRSRPKATRW